MWHINFNYTCKLNIESVEFYVFQLIICCHLVFSVHTFLYCRWTLLPVDRIINSYNINQIVFAIIIALDDVILLPCMQISAWNKTSRISGMREKNPPKNPHKKTKNKNKKNKQTKQNKMGLMALGPVCPFWSLSLFQALMRFIHHWPIVISPLVVYSYHFYIYLCLITKKKINS